MGWQARATNNLMISIGRGDCIRKCGVYSPLLERENQCQTDIQKANGHGAHCKNNGPTEGAFMGQLSTMMQCSMRNTDYAPYAANHPKVALELGLYT